MTTFEAGIDFSIELDINNDWKLELRDEYEGLPLYVSLGGKVTSIAMVERPAIKTKARARESDRMIMGSSNDSQPKNIQNYWCKWTRKLLLVFFS